jgi:hypothetical protein
MTEGPVAGSDAPFAGSPLQMPLANWSRYAGGTEDLVHITHEGFSRALREPEILRVLQAENPLIERAEWIAARAKPELERGFPTLHAHALLGLYGALECLIEDIFVAVIAAQPAVLASEAFDKLKLPVSLMMSEDLASRNAAVLREASQMSGFDLAAGVTKYERLLKFVGLNGPVPVRVKDSLYVSQNVRNVWAHRGGIADQRFVNRCPTFGVAVGDEIVLTTERFLPMMHGLHMYGMVVANRELHRLRRPRLDLECHGFEGCLSEIVHTE